MSIASPELWQWFTERPKWLQEAARRLFERGAIDHNDIEELLLLCKQEVGIEVDGADKLENKPIPADLVPACEPEISLALDEIADVKGINALAPRKPLKFGPEPLTIIYGTNGSGKSGYIRLLKEVCGGRGVRPLHVNVFIPQAQPQSCKIVYTLGGKKIELQWNPSMGTHPDLRSISIYDTACAHVYINNENEVAYEPALLGYFRRLVEVCEELDRLLAAEIAAKPSTKPVLPSEYSSTENGEWFNALTPLTSREDIETRCSWTKQLEAELVSLQQRVAEPSPPEKAKAVRKTKGHLIELVGLLRQLKEQLNDETFLSVQAMRTDAATKRQAADVDATKVFANAPLGGIASESWQLLWKQARLYSEQEAYKQIPFPNTAEKAVCVLCQQPLGADAKERLKNFEDFVKGNLEVQAAVAKEVLHNALEESKEPPKGAELDSKLDLAGVDDEHDRLAVKNYCTLLTERRESFLIRTAGAQLAAMPSDEVLVRMTELERSLEEQATTFDEAADGGKRVELQKNLRELSVQKWMSEQKDSIVTDVSRLCDVQYLESARRLSNTTALSSKKSTLAEELVTAAFTRCFQNELKALGASRVQVNISKTRTTKGHVWHQILLRDSKVPAATADVLSEGEFRVVSIAAFLADMDRTTNNTPFVFDDPVSSLDQDFEELTAARLVALSKKRQAIVFTHRLSLLAALQESAEKISIDCRVISLMRESWGFGEPNEPPLPTQKPKQALKTLIDHRLPKARKVWESDGATAYSVEGKALCSDIRITIERLIEYDLLADVVQRFRRPIHTLNKITKLAKISAGDCALLDEMMTKYSFYEHSQPNEAPVPLPEPDELSNDLQKLKIWQEEFCNRAIPNP